MKYAESIRFGAISARRHGPFRSKVDNPARRPPVCVRTRTGRPASRPYGAVDVQGRTNVAGAGCAGATMRLAVNPPLPPERRSRNGAALGRAACLRATHRQAPRLRRSAFTPARPRLNARLRACLRATHRQATRGHVGAGLPVLRDVQGRTNVAGGGTPGATPEAFCSSLGRASLFVGMVVASGLRGVRRLRRREPG